MPSFAFQTWFLAQGGDDFLARTFGGAHGSDQCPILVALTFDHPTAAAQQHAGDNTDNFFAKTKRRSTLQSLWPRRYAESNGKSPHVTSEKGDLPLLLTNLG